MEISCEFCNLLMLLPYLCPGVNKEENKGHPLEKPMLNSRYTSRLMEIFAAA